MAIDMATLKAATFGDQEAKIALKRSWLTEVYKLLMEGEQAKRELKELKRRVAEHNERSNKELNSDWEDFHSDFDEGMGKIFGEDGAMGRIFGKGRRRK